MLNSLRANFKEHPYLKVLLGFIALSMVGYLGSYFYDSSGGQTADWALKVNGESIGVREYINTARGMEEFYRRSLGDNFESYRESLRLQDMALQALSDQAMILQDARRMGLRISKTDVASTIRNQPNLRDENGRFVGTARYQEAVERSVPGGVVAYERSISDQMLIDIWTDLVTQPVTITDDEVEQTFRRQSETATIDYLMFPAAQQTVDSTVSDVAARAFYDANPGRYQRRDGLRIRWIVVPRDSQRPKLSISEEELRQAYGANAANYTHPEQRRARHILFKLEPGATAADKAALKQRAEETLSRVRAGEDFAALAASRSQDVASSVKGGDLGFFAREQMAAPISEAAFETPVGQLAPVTESGFGFHVIEVTDSRPPGTVPFEEVRDDLLRSRELAKLDELARDEAQRLRGEIAAAADLDSVAGNNGLAIGTGVAVLGERFAELGLPADFLSSLFTLEVGSVSQPVRVASGSALVAVEEKLPPAVASFEEVRSRVDTDVRNERTRDAAFAVAQQRATRGTLGEAGRAAGLEVRSGTIRPGESLPGTGGSPGELQVAWFGARAQVGARGVTRVPAGALAWELRAKQSFDRDQFDQQRESLRAEIRRRRRDAYRQGVLDALRTQQTIEINYAALQQFGS